MKILALPRDPNPYQQLLYAEFTRRGHAVRYVGELTPSHSLNLLLLPLELAVHRLRGWDALHIHWVFAFALPGGNRWRTVRRVARAWFKLVLAVAAGLRLRILWTAHNVLPHVPVFDDDLAARRALVRRCTLVVAHSQATLAELARLGIAPRRTLVAEHGTLTPDVDPASLPAPGAHGPPRRLLFFGRIEEYKGVEDLIRAVQRVSAPIRLLVAGECRDEQLRLRLRALAAEAAGRVQLRLERLAEDEVERLMGQADAVVLPYRKMTTSGSALLALGHGRPLIIPELPGLSELPNDAVLRYDGSVEGLAASIEELAGWPAERLQGLGRAGAAYTRTLRWDEMALAIVRALSG